MTLRVLGETTTELTWLFLYGMWAAVFGGGHGRPFSLLVRIHAKESDLAATLRIPPRRDFAGTGRLFI